MGFHLRKHYFDLCTDDGRVRIVYAARLRWGLVSVGYVGVLRDDGDGATTTGSTARVEDPSDHDGALHWASSALGLELTGRDRVRGPSLRLFDEPAGALDWDCHTLRAEVELRDRGERLRGWGYAETIEATVPPWALPFDALWWGRVHDRDRSLVWVVVEGERAPRPVFAEGARVDERGEVDEHGVYAAAQARVDFVEQRTLRSGRIGETVLDVVPGLDRFPGRILGLEETKRYARTPRGGQVIHERVVWPKPGR